MAVSESCSTSCGSAMSRSTLPKKCSLFLMIGPPSVKPHSVLPTSGFSNPLTSVKKSVRRHALAGEKAERRARQLIGARLGDGIDDRARRTAPFGVELVGDDLHFLDRFVRGARLAADVRPALLVGVARAVEHDVVGG